MELLTFPIKLSFSLRNFDERTAATITLRAPNGVTSAAGVNAYANRFVASPTPTEIKEYYIKSNRLILTIADS